MRSRIHEVGERVITNGRWTATGHALFAACIAGSIAFAATQIGNLSLLEFESSNPIGGSESKRGPIWYGTMVLTPLILSAILSIIWHWKGAPWLEKVAFNGYVLHTFYVPPTNEASVKMPAPETYLVIAATASAGAIIGLDGQPEAVVEWTATLVGALTAAAIVFSNPNGGAIAVRGSMVWQHDELYKLLLSHKTLKQRDVLRRQRYQCRECKKSLTNKDCRFGLLNADEMRPRELTVEHIKAVCKRCAVKQPTTMPTKDLINQKV